MAGLDVTISRNLVYSPIFSTQADLVDLWGGRGGGRSHELSTIILLGLVGQQKFRAPLMRSVFTNVRKSLWRELMDRIREWGIPTSLFRINDALMTCEYVPTGNSVFAHGFKGATKDATAQQKSLAGVTHAFIDEADENDWEDFKQLSVTVKRTKATAYPCIYRAFNPPPKDHWIMKRYYNLSEAEGFPGYFKATPKSIPGFLSIYATYRDNIDNMNPIGIRELEAYGDKDDPMYDPVYYAVNVLALVAETKVGRIYQGWKPMTVAQFESLRGVKMFYVIDFGYSRDPDTITKVKWHKNSVWVHEKMNMKGLSPDALHMAMKSFGIKPDDLIICDNDPRLIGELRRTRVVIDEKGKQTKLMGFKKIRKQKKPPGSKLSGIKIMQTMNVYYTETSANIIEEYQNYSWKSNDAKELLKEPVDKWDHHLDPIRAGIYTLLGGRARVK